MHVIHMVFKTQLFNFQYKSNFSGLNADGSFTMVVLNSL